MAYFSNGTEGLSYQEHYCFRCEHEEDGCAIWDAHLFYCREKAARPVLDMLIPMVDHTFKDGVTLKVAGACRFFTRKQLELPDGD